MTDHKPLFRKIIDAIHALQRKTATVEERANGPAPAWPACVSGTPRHGTAVSPCHALYAAHYPISVGDVLKFGLEERTVTKAVRIGGDLGVASWTKPITAKPMSILPWDWMHHLPVLRNRTHFRRPITAWRCARGQVLRTPISYIQPGGMGFHLGNKDFPGVQGAILPGDSGGPVFLALPELVLIGLVGGGPGGPSVTHFWQEVTEATDWRVREAELGQ
jgi:hypothetical protein